MLAQIDLNYIRVCPTRLWSRFLSYALFEGRPLTTRGRWINPFVLANLSIARNLPSLKRVKAPVYIIGTGRSGTTILGIILSAHRQVGFLNEPKALWYTLYKNEDLIGSYTRAPARYRLSEIDVTSDISKAAHRIYGFYLLLTGAERVVDKYPELVFRYSFVKAIFPDARFLFLTRDGWQTCASIEQWSNRLGKNVAYERHDWWGANDRKWILLVNQIIPEHSDLASHQQTLLTIHDHRVRAAVEWIVSMREGLRLTRTYPETVMRISYEQLCMQPEQTLCDIAKFIELDNDPHYLQYALKVLKPPRTGDKFNLPSWLHEPFQQTHCELGYGNNI